MDGDVSIIDVSPSNFMYCVSSYCSIFLHIFIYYRFGLIASFNREALF